jgi:hypothetical protein
LLVLIVCFPLLMQAQRYPALADTLSAMVVIDQKAAGLPPEGMQFNSPEWSKFKDSIFSLHHEKMEVLFARYGYPGYAEVGEKGSKNFWLLVQHLDKWPSFQEKVLESMKKQLDRKNASSVDYAYLTDRVRLNTNRKQVYGTQVTYNVDSCQAVPKPLEEPQKVNLRRKQVGLEPVEEYMNQMSEMHFQMNREMYEKKGIKAAKLYRKDALRKG